MDDLTNFHTFRQQTNLKEHTLHLQQLASQLQTELRMTLQRQEILRNANDKLTRIIIRHNNQQENRNQKFIRCVEELGQKRRQKSTRRNRVNQDMVSHNSSTLRPSKSTKKHARIRTEVSDQNDFMALNCNRSTISRRDVKQKLSKMQARDRLC